MLIPAHIEVDALGILLGEPGDRAAFATAEDGSRHRLILSRVWDPALPTVAIVGWNPSTATASCDDHTIRRCRALLPRDVGGFWMVNLLSQISTNPAALSGTLQHPDALPVLRSLERAKYIIAAWGNPATTVAARRAALTARRELDRLAHPMFSWGVTSSGSPRHPSRLPNRTPLQPFLDPRDFFAEEGP